MNSYSSSASETQCVHCSKNTPDGRFCVHCGLPLRQPCPYHPGEFVVPLLTLGRPTRRCPECGKILLVCADCKRLHDARATFCRNCGESLKPTTVLQDGGNRSGSLHGSLYWYLDSLSSFNIQSLEGITMRVEQAAYANERLAVLGTDMDGRMQFWLYHPVSPHGQIQKEIVGGTPPWEPRTALLLGNANAGILRQEGATLFQIAGKHLESADIGLDLPPIGQEFTTSCWWIMTHSAGLVQLQVYSLNSPEDGRSVVSTISVDNLAEMVACGDCLLLVTRDGQICRITESGDQVTSMLWNDAKRVIGVTPANGRLWILARSATHLHVCSWTVATGSVDMIVAEPFQEANLFGPIVTPRALYFYTERALFAYDIAGAYLIEERLPAGSRIVQVSAVEQKAAKHILFRQTTNGADSWQIWTPVARTRRSVGYSYAPHTITGLIDNGFYLISPIENVGGGVQCEIRLGQFG